MSRAVDTQSRIFREITCDQAILDDPAGAPAEIARVLRSAREFSLPVYIELPRDLVGTEVEAVQTLPPRPADPDALSECADEVIARLRAASHPVLMVDVETRRYGVEDKVARLARRLDLPVVTSFMGRGLLSAHPDLVRGTYLGAAGDPEITALVEDSDGLLLLGVILSDTNFAVSQRKIDMRHAILALDRKVRVGHHTYAEIPLDALVDAAARPSGRRDRRVAPARRRSDPAEPPARGRRACRAVGRRSRDQRPLRRATAPCRSRRIWAIACSPPWRSPTPIWSRQATTPAWDIGVPAGLGVCVATGARPLIMVGDGAFQMTGFELGNCRRYGWDPIVVVFNNMSWEMLRVFQPESRFNDLDDWRFAELAGPLGGDGVRVRTRRELAAALEAAHARRGRFQLHRSDAAARPDLRHARPFCCRLQGGARAAELSFSGAFDEAATNAGSDRFAPPLALWPKGCPFRMSGVAP